MQKINTADCKNAVVQLVINAPGCVGASFCDERGNRDTPFKLTADGRTLTVAEFEKPAQVVSNWKRVEKRKITQDEAAMFSVPVGMTLRMFECSVGDVAQNTYEDQLRAYTFDDGHTICRVFIVGE